MGEKKYETMKENVRNVSEKQKNMRLNSMNSRKIMFVNMWLVKNYQTFYEIKKFYFTLCIYKMYLISTEGYKNVGVHFFKSKKNWQNLGKYEKCTRWFGC